MIRTAIRKKHAEDPDLGLDSVLSAVNGNVGFIFAKNCTLDFVRETINKHRVSKNAKVGVLAPVDVIIPAGPTGMDPSQTTLFQTLNVATKIVKGQIEIVSDMKACITGTKVGASAAALLAKLNIKPFEYGMEVKFVIQDGAVFPSAVLDMDDGVIIGKFVNGCSHMAAFSREVGIPTEAALPHMFAGAMKNIASLCGDIDFDFKEIEEPKKFLADPAAYKAANPGGGGGGGGGGGAKPAAAAKEEKKAVEEEEEEEDMDFDLFG
jgi:large subunit ribosomal protein LP0